MFEMLGNDPRVNWCDGLYDRVPMDTDEIADSLITHGPKAALWEMAELAKEIPGGWNLYVATRDALYTEQMKG